MRLYKITEHQQDTTIQASDPTSAIRHYAEIHGWRLPEGMLRIISPGHWVLFGGEIHMVELLPVSSHP